MIKKVAGRANDLRGVARLTIAGIVGVVDLVEAMHYMSDRLIGDGIVPLESAMGRHPNPRLTLQFDPSRLHVAYRTNHLELLSRPAVYRQLKEWLAAAPGARESSPCDASLPSVRRQHDGLTQIKMSRGGGH